MKIPIALLDANVLYKERLRSFFIYLALTKACKVRWTEQINDEWKRNLVVKNPSISSKKIDETIEIMNDSLANANIENYERHMETLRNHEKDRHVLASAIEGRCNYIVTFNISDFPKSSLSEYDITAIHPDTFISSLRGAKIMIAFYMMKEDLTKSRPTAEQLTAVIANNGLTKTADLIKQLI